MESLGEWRSSGVLLHLPLAKRAIPEKLVPQSELICRRLFLVLRLFTRPSQAARSIIGYSSILVYLIREDPRREFRRGKAGSLLAQPLSVAASRGGGRAV